MMLIELRLTRPTEDLSGTGATCAGIVEAGAQRWSVWYWQTKLDTLPEDQVVAQLKIEFFNAEFFIGGEKYVCRCRDPHDLFFAVPLVESDLRDRMDKARESSIDWEDLPF